MIDREAIKKRMRERAPGTFSLCDDTTVEHATDVAADLLREFGHVARCMCCETVCHGLECDRLDDEHPHRDPSCFQQSPAKES